MIFRKAVQPDFDSIQNLYWTLIDREQDNPSFPHWKKGIHPSDEMLQESIEKGEMYVLADGEVAACVIANNEKVDEYVDVPWQVDSDDVTVLHILAVHPDQRGKGLARELMAKMIGLERSKGKKALRLDVIENNVTAEKFYQKTGFQYIQTKTLYYDVVGEMVFKLYELVL
ncbi:GNAT family N-acetyltransferase [Novisyntrophococcus fermenticellae]|uniref:GNAT family N-acetyltransferase n=1 Tax=Novisyntrophococcus fermenticellae TaxID=2068655 RepID=UPI001E380230|nr:GNAT family N-acetyltransferase [Novisyntrophococcus fermenticellae]